MKLVQAISFLLLFFRLILVLRNNGDVNNLQLNLRKTETSDYNDQLLDVNWTEEKQRASSLKVKPSINRAIFKASGWTFVRNEIPKVLWGISLWLGAYWLLKQTITLVRDITEPKYTNETLFNA